MKHPYLVQITVQDWINEELYPRYKANRDEKKRMNKDHMKGAIISPEQAVVRAVKLGNELIKIDGHSRAEAWRRGQLDHPAMLTLMIFPIDTEEEMEPLYKCFNSKVAAETPAEQAFHANKVVEFTPSSKFVKASWKAAFAILGYQDQVVAMKHFDEERRLIDSWGINKAVSAEFSTGVKAAILKTLKDNPEAAAVFWDLYRDPESNVAEVNQIRKIVQEHRGVSSAATVGIMFTTCLGAFASWEF